MASDPAAAPVLRLTIDVPGFYVDGTEDGEDIEVAMQLSTEQVGLTFAHTEGDSPTLHLKTMEGRIVKYEVAADDPHVTDGSPCWCQPEREDYR